MGIQNTKVVCLFLFTLNSALISGQLRTYPIPPAYFHSTNSLPILRYLHTALSINVMYQFPVQVQRLKPMFEARTVYFVWWTEMWLPDDHLVLCVLRLCDYCQSANTDHLLWFMYFFLNNAMIYYIFCIWPLLTYTSRARSWLWAWITFIINWLSVIVLLRIHAHAGRFESRLVHVIGKCTYPQPQGLHRL